MYPFRVNKKQIESVCDIVDKEKQNITYNKNDVVILGYRSGGMAESIYHKITNQIQRLNNPPVYSVRFAIIVLYEKNNFKIRPTSKDVLTLIKTRTLY